MESEISRPEAKQVYSLCYKYVVQKTTNAVRAWYEDMATKCTAAAARIRNNPEAPTQLQLMQTLLRTCAFEVGVEEAAKRQMTTKFVEFVTADFTDCKQTYQQLFVSKSRMLASPIVASSEGGRAKFRVPSCDAFLGRVLAETAKVAIGCIDCYLVPADYERQSTKIAIRYGKTIKGKPCAAM